jgi:hypothetical protein
MASPIISLGQYTAWGNAYGWPILGLSFVDINDSASYFADMMTAMGHPLVAATYALFPQFGDPLISPVKQNVAPTLVCQPAWAPTPLPAEPSFFAPGPQYMSPTPQAAPPAPQAMQAIRVQASHNLCANRAIAPPARPFFWPHRQQPTEVPSHLRREQQAAPQEPIDLTGDDDKEVEVVPAPQQAGTNKRARADSTSGVAVKKAKKEKKAKAKATQPRIARSGLREEIFPAHAPAAAAAATFPPGDNNTALSSLPETETPAAEQQEQQQQSLSPAATTASPSNAADTTTTSESTQSTANDTSVSDPHCNAVVSKPEQHSSTTPEALEVSQETFAAALAHPDLDEDDRQLLDALAGFFGR